MTVSPDALTADWLGACRRAADGLRAVMREHPTSKERIEETGVIGEGGDRTLVIDQESEDGVFRELEKLHDAGARFQAVSEERGLVDFGSEDVTVVIDPIDGSLNAKRGLPHVGLSIAVASGFSMADVEFGYVLDLGTEEEWVARAGEGVLFCGEPLPDPPPERRTKDGKLEVVAIESSDPRWIAPHIGRLEERVHRIRAIGSVAISLCQVANTRVDGMLTLWNTRAVDCAAGQFIVRESGAHVVFPGCGDGPLDCPLDLEPHAPVVAARTEQGIEDLIGVLGR
ncbi:MAG: Inositol-1-monophosphatase [uncultured Solirubrobacteraceae bacterium]|uniref:inositol-phosphate phosphatase n=1 Tax=uncultured Solirubrobacteraceae bacterium TaxID=1162706 RepID=A0A6J4SRY7_9ACTN|nr:MAG: Inositol-1-monophosphatase [uncultured Solirubrobacteraceae bacterium]